MTKEERLPKRSHKLLLLVLKFIPMVTALCYLLNTVFACFGIDTPILSHISGMSLLPWLFILIATFVFRFCNTIVHEAKHVQSHICMYYGVDEDTEDAAYLIGYIIMKMYDGFAELLCPCQ